MRVLRQVVLSLQLSLAVISLVRFTYDRFKMGEFANPWWHAALAWAVAVIIASLNAWLLIQAGMGWLER
jgi:manganese transport protein